MNTIEAKIVSNGKPISTNIISLDIIKVVNKIPYARAEICEGGKTDNKSLVELSNENFFQPGQEIELGLSDGENSSSFKGIVVKQNLKKTADDTILTIEIKDSAQKLTLLRNNAVFLDKDDQQIITDIAGGKQLKVECAAQTLQHKQLIQYYCTDWDFIVSRAEANGLFVAVENGTLNLQKPDLLGAATEISEIYEYEIETDLGAQYQEIESICWDMKEVKPAKFKNTNTSELKQQLNSEHDYDQLANAMGANKYTVVSGIHSEREEMEAWANAVMIKNRHSLLRGRISIQGNAKLKLGDTITIGGMGAVFNGTALISGIRHRINQEGWITDLQCGLSAAWFYQNEGIVEKPAAGLLPGIHGLQVGVVEAFPGDGDPDKLHRIQVRIPAIHETQSVIWARLLFPYAGDQRGIFWVPEEGDEVVIGFFNDDPRQAVILGALYNGKTAAPLEFTAENNQKGFITRNGIKMIFTDEADKEKLEITTPGGNKALLEDENGITVEDKNKNKVTMNDTGVCLEDKNKNKITTDDQGIILEDTNKNSVTLNGQGLEIKDANGNTISLSSAGIEIKDLNGNKAALEAGGITIQSGANVNVKGAMVNLN